MLHGRILDSTTLSPIAGAAIQLTGPADLLRGLPGAVALPDTGAPTWTRILNGFAGTRWQCWVANVRDAVPGISWPEFRDQALVYNPQLAASGRLFHADQSYLLPAPSAAPPARWTRTLTGFAGTRWDCWVANVRDQVPGIGWAEFRDKVLYYNQLLATGGRMFQPDRSYVIPQTDRRPWMAFSTTSAPDGSFQLPLTRGGPVDLSVTAEGYLPDLRQISLAGAADPLACLVQLQPAESRRSGSIRSALPGYAGLAAPRRALIEAALFMLGDDRQTYDALPPEWQAHCFGHRYATQPEHRSAKDIGCADVVTIALLAAGCALPKSNLFLSDSYHPARLGALGIEIDPAGQLQPGDILVYGNGARDNHASHVTLYVGPFWGTDRSGGSYPLAAGYDVVEGSLLGTLNGHTIGRGVIGVTLAQCLRGRRGYAWVRAVRLRSLEAMLKAA